ncbi:MAG: lipoprotein signal peptidase [bacterium]
MVFWKSKSNIAWLVIIAVLLADQIIKIWIKTSMIEGQEFNVIGDWFRIHFTENKGMAFGLEFGGDTGKLFLSVFRIIAVVGIGWYLRKLILEKMPVGLVISVSLILAGALGNIIDSAFYGLIFDHSVNQVADFCPEDGGYAGFLHGKVVDMLYFPVFKGFLPSWMPFWGNDYFIFFRPVFNIADAAISTGVAMVLVFQKRYFKETSK